MKKVKNPLKKMYGTKKTRKVAIPINVNNQQSQEIQKQKLNLFSMNSRLVKSEKDNAELRNEMQNLKSRLAYLEQIVKVTSKSVDNLRARRYFGDE